MLRAFIDDSGSGGDSPWYVLAGYIGTVEGWGSFDAEWCSVLGATPVIEYFKSSEAERLHSRSQWAGISEEQRNLKIDALIEVIGRCSRRAISARIRQRDYDELVKGNVPPEWDSPYYFLLPAIVGAAINIERLDGGSESVDFVFDSDQKHEKGSRQLLPALMPMRSYHGLLVDLAHRDEKDFLPLQAADLLAWQIRRFFSVRDEPRRKHFDSARLAPPAEPHSFVYTRDSVRWMISEIQNRAAERAASLGRSADVRTWT